MIWTDSATFHSPCGMKITNNSTRALLWLLVQPVHSGEHTYFLVAWSEFARQRSVLVIIRNAGNTISRGFQRTLQVKWNCDERQTKLAQTDANVTDTDWLLYIALYMWDECRTTWRSLYLGPLRTEARRTETYTLIYTSCQESNTTNCRKSKIQHRSHM